MWSRPSPLRSGHVKHSLQFMTKCLCLCQPQSQLRPNITGSPARKRVQEIYFGDAVNNRQVSSISSCFFLTCCQNEKGGMLQFWALTTTESRRVFYTHHRTVRGAAWHDSCTTQLTRFPQVQTFLFSLRIHSVILNTILAWLICQ